MKIYFAGSIRAGRDDAEIYRALILWMKAFGEVLTEHVGDLSMTKQGDDGPDDRFIHNRDMAWLETSDCVVAEVTLPSLGVGYELGRAVALKKPILCLYRATPGRILSAMIAGSPGLKTALYSNLDEAKTIVEEFFSSVGKRLRALPDGT